MNNTARGMIFVLFFVGTGIMFFATLASATPAEFKPEDLAETLVGGFSMLSCAVIAAAALSGMTPPRPTQMTAPYPGQYGPGQQQAQPYPYQAAPQPYAPPQQYGQQNPPQGSQ